jgi:DNA-binding transcriptional regulator LsrR (DeoR family)
MPRLGVDDGGTCLHICSIQTCTSRAPPPVGPPVSDSDLQQLIRVSRLYYELGETQSAVAEQLGVTRPQVSRLLKRARAEGIVEIRIVDRTTAESPAAEAIRGTYGLDAVHLAPTLAGPEDLTRRMVGRLAAQVLRAAVRDGAIVGIGDGASVSAAADALDEVPSPISATIVPLAGGHWSSGAEREPFRRIADALGAQVHGLMAPGLVDDAATRRSLVAHAGVRAVLDLWDRLDLAFFGIGGRGWGAASVGATVEQELEAADAVGEVLIAPFDIDGRFVGEPLRERVIAFDARALGRVPVSIAVASGESKVRPVLGALRAGVVRTLVTDVATAEAVVELDRVTLADGSPLR